MRPARFLVFQCTKTRKDNFKISELAFKDIALDEKRLYGQHLVVKCSLLDAKKARSSQALIDCGAFRFAYIDENIACQHNFPLFSLKISRSLQVIDRRPIKSGDRT